jgi:hypothetical protein
MQKKKVREVVNLRAPKGLTKRKVDAAIKRVKKKIEKKKPEELFLEQIIENRLDRNCEFYPQHKFHPTRKWRFDFAWDIDHTMYDFGRKKIAVEVQGGVWSGGGHVTGSGYTKDCEKLNEAQILGWDVLYITSSMVRDGSGIDYLKRLLER